MINYWRYDRYVDDGCVLYQCLKCYGSWESTGPPGYMFEGIYHRTWRFCPICGTEWTGQHLPEGESESDPQRGPRRRRIINAIEARYNRDSEAYYRSDRRGPLPGQHTPVWFWWVIEEQSQIFAGLDWEPKYRMNGLKVSAIRVFEILTRQRKSEPDCKYRVRIVSATEGRGNKYYHAYETI